MRTTDFSRVFASAPLDAKAATVTGSARHHYEPQINVPRGKDHWDAPPRVVPPHRYPKAATFVDLRGHKMGWMTVVGYLGKINNSGKARWLLKCSCGDYEARGQKAIVNNDDEMHSCHNCGHHRTLRKRKMPDVDTWLSEKRDAQGIEARSDETRSGSAEGESAVDVVDAP